MSGKRHNNTRRKRHEKKQKHKAVQKVEPFSLQTSVDFKQGMDYAVRQIVDMLQSGVADPVEFPITHRFTPGLYIREMKASAGSILAGRTHKFEHPFILSKGKLTVFSETGGLQELTAPFIGITKPGTARLAYFHEDTVWTTFHPTELTDIDEIEAYIMEPFWNPLLTKAENQGIIDSFKMNHYFIPPPAEVRLLTEEP